MITLIKILNVFEWTNHDDRYLTSDRGHFCISMRNISKYVFEIGSVPFALFASLSLELCRYSSDECGNIVAERLPFIRARAHVS
jgi:hypothetical protein